MGSIVALWVLLGAPVGLRAQGAASAQGAPRPRAAVATGLRSRGPAPRTAAPPAAPPRRLAPPRRVATARPAPEDDAPPADAQVLPPEERPYESIRIEVVGLRWLGPGQQGVIEAHPLLMGLAAMALATVALIFFFLRGVHRPHSERS